MKTMFAKTLVLSLILTTSTAALAAEQIASGAGHFPTGPDGDLRTFAFVANKDSSGVTVGELQLNNRALDSKTHAQIDCLVVDGNVATMSGFVERNTAAAPFPEGTPILVQVVDHGEGAGAPTDQISLMFLFPGGPGFPCTTPNLVLPLNEIEQGNIQVH